MNMDTVTIIPKELAGRDDLVIIPRQEYEKLLELRKVTEFKPTALQKRALVQAERNLLKGKSLSYNDLVKKLGLSK